MIPPPEIQPYCHRCSEAVECEEVTGLLCAKCWLEDEELRQMAHVTERIERRMGL